MISSVLARGWERADALLILYLEFFGNRIKRATHLAFRKKIVKAPFICLIELDSIPLLSGEKCPLVDPTNRNAFIRIHNSSWPCYGKKHIQNRGPIGRTCSIK